MAGLVRKKHEDDEDENIPRRVAKKVSKPVKEEEYEEEDQVKLVKKKTKKPEPVQTPIRKESIGITGTGPIATEFRNICQSSGINMSFELCKMIRAFNESKRG